jgi:hypothetical protein
MDMLVELAAANAAFSVIKKTLLNGKSMLDAGDAVYKYFKAENDIAKEVAAKGKNSALEAWQAQQQLRRQEGELKELLNSQQLMGYHDFIQFRAEYAREQKEAAKQLAKKKYIRQQEIEDSMVLGIKVMSGLLVTVGIISGVAIYLR